MTHMNSQEILARWEIAAHAQAHNFVDLTKCFCFCPQSALVRQLTLENVVGLFFHFPVPSFLFLLDYPLEVSIVHTELVP